MNLLKNLHRMESKEGDRLLKLGLILFHYNIKEKINKGRMDGSDFINCIKLKITKHQRHDRDHLQNHLTIR